MKQQHVRRVRDSGTLTGVVHAEDQSEPGVTFCGWSFATDQTIHGKTIYMAADVPDELTCQKCKKAMRTLLHDITKLLSPQAVEEVYEYATEIIR